MPKFRFEKESLIQDAILRYLEYKKILHWRMALGPIMGHKNGKPFWRKNPLKGFPDIAGVLEDGRFFVIEVKSETGRLTKDQKMWKELLIKHKVKYILAKSLHDVTKEIT